MTSDAWHRMSPATGALPDPLIFRMGPAAVSLQRRPVSGLVRLDQTREGRQQRRTARPDHPN
ncbi:MAG: hypothetical protein OXH38_09170 [Chloroflexi bacterium]|nr:hypothetical protein [Chloroflexota bacterium]